MDFDALFSKRSTHIKPGLERIARSYEFLGRPAQSIPSVLIGGTNGKGSTSGFLWSLLSQNQRPCALYSSPHLSEFSERFQLSHMPTDDTEIARYVTELEATLPPELYTELSFFEAATLVAFQLFAARDARFQVLEVGLGGRWDATNISDPLVSVLVSVSRDHEEYLGRDIRQILREKLGIMRPGRPFFWGGGGEILEVPEHRSIIEAACVETGAPLIEAGRHFAVKGRAIELRLPSAEPETLLLPGAFGELAPFLLRNLALAAAVYAELSRLRRDSKEPLLPLREVWPRFLAGETSSPVSLIGRCQRLQTGAELGSQKLLVDVCHNPDGARNFAAAIAQAGLKPLPALVSILRDKNYDMILDILRQSFQPLLLFGVDHSRGWQPQELAERHRDLAFYPSFQEAWAAMQQKGDETAGRAWAVCGSVLAVGRVLKTLDLSPRDMHVARVVAGDWPWPAAEQLQ